MSGYKFPLHKYDLVDIDDAISPKNKDIVQIYENSTWIVIDRKFVLFRRGGGTMSNANPIIVNKDTRVFRNCIDREISTILLPIVFVPVD